LSIEWAVAMDWAVALWACMDAPASHRELSWEQNRKTKNRGCFLKQKRKNQTM